VRLNPLGSQTIIGPTVTALCKGEVGGMMIGRGIRKTQRKPAPVLRESFLVVLLRAHFFNCVSIGFTNMVTAHVQRRWLHRDCSKQENELQGSSVSKISTRRSANLIGRFITSLPSASEIFSVVFPNTKDYL
jgi:hypothetical protein